MHFVLTPKPPFLLSKESKVNIDSLLSERILLSQKKSFDLIPSYNLVTDNFMMKWKNCLHYCLDLPNVWTPAEKMNTFQEQHFLCSNLLPTCVSLPEVQTLCTAGGEKTFTSTDKLQKCQMCPKSFSSAEHLRRHMRIHTNEKPYKCQFCYKTFAQVDYLKKHVRTHSTEKPFKCQCCHKVFAQVDHVRRHMRIHTAEKPYKCPLCYKQFALVDYLKKHVRLHAGGKPYSCQCCQKAFAQVDHLRRHLRIHTSEKLFKCQLCCKEFTLVDYLKKHSRMHAREKPYKCLCCQKSFSQSDRLKRHIKTHTGWAASERDATDHGMQLTVNIFAWLSRDSLRSRVISDQILVYYLQVSSSVTSSVHQRHGGFIMQRIVYAVTNIFNMFIKRFSTLIDLRPKSSL